MLTSRQGGKRQRVVKRKSTRQRRYGRRRPFGIESLEDRRLFAGDTIDFSLQVEDFAEPDFVIQLGEPVSPSGMSGESALASTSQISDRSFPNDPGFPNLYALNNTGQTGGRKDADIDAPEAWQQFSGTDEVVVAVIDSGVDYNHEDLAANMWVNPCEIPGDGIDNDGNGYVDDIHGIDTANGDSDPMDDNGHGTHVAGTIAAVGDNGLGVAGVSRNAQIMALKCTDRDGYVSIAGAIEALQYMIRMKTDYGVDVVVSNNSWGGTLDVRGGLPGELLALRDVIEATTDAGILFVAAAGNDCVNNDGLAARSYPASFDLDGIVSVAATDHSDALASFSNYGRDTVDVAAPGVDIVSTYPGDRYAFASGTSMAAPACERSSGDADGEGSWCDVRRCKDGFARRCRLSVETVGPDGQRSSAECCQLTGIGRHRGSNGECCSCLAESCKSL